MADRKGPAQELDDALLCLVVGGAGELPPGSLVQLLTALQRATSGKGD